jgi:cyclic pyranopterin monophosphate synthase
MNNDDGFSHVQAGLPALVDITQKSNSLRMAKASSSISMPVWLTKKLVSDDLCTKKGPIFQTAIIAGTMAVKNTPQLIPLCHTIPIEDVRFSLAVLSPGVIGIECEVKSTARTGVEMEALTGASVAALTIYDMCKGLSFALEIGPTKLIKKTGGRRDVSINETCP